MEKPIGEPIGKLKKFFIGFGGLFIVVFLVAGPLIIFSSLNPVSTDNKVTGSTLRFNIEAGLNGPNGVLNTYNILLYQNNYVLQLQDISNFLFEDLNLGTNIETRNFDRGQFQVVEMSANSDSVWVLSPPNQDKLFNIIDTAYNEPENPEVVIYLTMQSTFDR